MSTIKTITKALEQSGHKVVISHSPARRITNAMIYSPRYPMPYFGEARCREEDEWNFEFGANLAFNRALREMYTTLAQSTNLVQSILSAHDSQVKSLQCILDFKTQVRLTNEIVDELISEERAVKAEHEHRIEEYGW